MTSLQAQFKIVYGVWFMSKRIVYCDDSGQVFTFSDDWNTDDGKVKKLKYKLAPGKSVLPHIHPGTSQYFRVLSGQLTIRNGFKKMILTTGQEVKTGIGGQHSQCNDTSEEVEVEEGYEPPIDIEPFFTALPHAQKSRNFLKIMVFFSDFSHVVTSKSLLARMIIKFFGCVGNIFGYRNWYLPHIKRFRDR